MSVFPVQLAIEVVEIADDDFRGGYHDKITLVAYVGSQRQEIASTEAMTGYEAANDPVGCLRHLMKDLLS